mgnify:CR=1 FL=1
MVTRNRTGYRLKPTDAGDLEWRFNYAEGELGLRSKDGLAFELARQGIEQEFNGGGRKSDPMPDHQEKARRRLLRVDGILSRVSFDHHTTLLCVYSLHARRLAVIAHGDEFGDVAPIAIHTASAKAHLDDELGTHTSLNAALRKSKAKCVLARAIWREANAMLRDASVAYESARRAYDAAARVERNSYIARMVA